MATSDDNITISTCDSLQKEKTARSHLRKTFVENINLPVKFKLLIIHAVIESILLYRMHLFKLHKHNYAQMQSLYSKYTRGITRGVKNPILTISNETSRYESKTVYQTYKSDCDIWRLILILGRSHYRPPVLMKEK